LTCVFCIFYLDNLDKKITRKEDNMDNTYSKLFERTNIGKVEFNNRIGMAAMGTNSEDERGLMVDSQIQYYEERAKGGVGLIITEGQFVTRYTDPMRLNQTGVDSEMQTERWTKLAQAVHAHGVKVALQVICGLGRLSAAIPGAPQPTACSETPNLSTPGVMCRPLSVDEIHEVVACFDRAADRAVRAGMDMIEINAHLGYLLDEFMTPLWNHRTDEYGGSFENRMRFITEIVKAIRKAAGPDFPIIVKVGVWHDIEGGRTIEEGIEVCKYLESIGVDAIDVNIGQHENELHAVPYVYEKSGFALPYAEMVKQAVGIPVLNAGKHTPETARQAVENNQVDIVLFGRALIADAELANKLKYGNVEDIRPCMSCNQLCLGGYYIGKAVSCAGNFVAGSEAKYKILKTSSPKNVVVIGGGPGGMEAARVAALKGHHVTLYEKGDKLGGQMNFACIPSFRWQVGALRDWLIRQLDKTGVEVVAGKEITADSPELAVADRIIVSLGAKPFVPPIKGSDLPNIVEVTDAHINPDKIKGNRVVIAGGGMSGCDCALENAMEGKEVTIVEMQPTLITDEVIMSIRLEMLHEFEKYGIRQLVNTKILEFKPDCVVLQNESGTFEVPMDTAVAAFGMKPEKSIAEAICAKYPTAVSIGDCNGIGVRIGGAIRGGFLAAWNL
jgi:2,4-dienoyl-CoA reductase-like NADH-dependent reductase (Old Yellow Enzyme family)/thioredoxin reductase